MGLIICYSCGRQRNLPKVKRQRMVCSNCGAHGPRLIHRITSRMRLNGIVEEDMQGVELHAAREQTLAGLKWIADEKGYKPLWPMMQFKKIYGREPNGEAGCEMAAPRTPLLHWVQRQNAAYKRRMRALEAAQVESLPPKESEPLSPLMSAEDWNVAL